MTDTEKARLRIEALLLPRRAVTEAETQAVDAAAELQAEYEREFGEGVTSLSRSNDGVSVSARRDSRPFGLCASALAALKKAGLIKGGLPRATPV